MDSSTSRASPTPPTQAEAMASTSRASRGSTPTASRSASRLVREPSADRPARAASSNSLKQKTAAKGDEQPRPPSKADEQLRSLRAEFDGLRAHLTCKICDRLLYQPYTIACGHTYCYTCLCTWFLNCKSNKAKCSCPDCRVDVKHMPAPAYVIRDMTAVFIARAELLPAGETLEEHKKWQQDDADAVQKDRENADPRNGGLFKGLFNAPAHPLRPSLHIVRDQEDGVDRCPICTWELEDGGCTQCGLVFDETGEVSWDNSFTGFSDMDEMSEHDADDLEAAMGYDEEGEFEGFGDPMDGWQDYLGDPGADFVMRRFLQHGNAGPRRHMSHSEAGSRRSYSQSIVSDVYGDEMDTVEEEDEEEDSEMNDFIDDAALEDSTSASGASSTPGQTPQPTAAPSNRPRARARARPVVEESETSSTISSVAEEEGEDDDDDDTEEDAGPVRRGQRPQAPRPSSPRPSAPRSRPQDHVLSRANGTRSRFARVVASSPSASEDTSTDELEEDEQALLEEEGWMRQTDDDEMDEEEDGDSDGAATTVGWEPLANSNDRSRMGGSLTPTADRPRPSAPMNAPIRPPSRVGNLRALDASRGLRRRSSVLSNANPHYEDGEADDDDSEQDGDVSMAMNTLRSRRSQLMMRNGPALQNAPTRFPSQAAAAATNEADTDDNSDNSQAGLGRRAPRTQRREYDPRISWMFAAHQAALQQHSMGGDLIDLGARSITPLNRAPSSNRNRQSPAPASFSPFMPPARMRTPLTDSTNFGLRVMSSPNRRSAMSPALPTANVMENAFRNDRTPSVSSASNDSVILTPGTSTPSLQHSIDQSTRTHSAAAMDMIDRPQSRVGPRPPSAASNRRSSGNFSPMYQNFPSPNVGMHPPASAVPARPANPWAAYVHTIRARNSRLGLREQSSTATLRPASSRANMHDAAAAAPVIPAMRTQASRLGLRSQPSVRRLNAQPSVRALRTTPSPGPNPQMARIPPGLTPDDVNARARELRNTREQALGLSNTVPARTNPFARRQNNAGNNPPVALGPGVPQHIRSNSNESAGSVNSAGTAHSGSGPSLGRRRSNRNMMNAPSPGVLPPSQAFTSPVTAYANGSYRARQGNNIGPLAAFDQPVQNNNRAANPVVTGQLI